MAHTARAKPVFISMKQLGVLLVPPGWDARPLQGFLQKNVASTHLCTWMNRDNVEQRFSSKETLNSNAETNLASNHRPSDLPNVQSKVRRTNHYTRTAHLNSSSFTFRFLFECYLRIRFILHIVIINPPMHETALSLFVH